MLVSHHAGVDGIQPLASRKNDLQGMAVPWTGESVDHLPCARFSQRRGNGDPAFRCPPKERDFKPRSGHPRWQAKELCQLASFVTFSVSRKCTQCFFLVSFSAQRGEAERRRAETLFSVARPRTWTLTNSRGFRNQHKVSLSAHFVEPIIVLPCLGRLAVGLRRHLVLQFCFLACLPAKMLLDLPRATGLDVPCDTCGSALVESNGENASPSVELGWK